MAEQEKLKGIDWLESSLKAYASEDDRNTSQISTNLKEVLKKTGVIAINSVKGAFSLLRVAGNALMASLHFAKVFIDIPSYALSSDEDTVEKSYNTLKSDATAVKDYAYEVCQDIGNVAYDVLDVIEASAQLSRHGSKATYTATCNTLTFMYDASKKTAEVAGVAVESLQNNLPKVMPNVIPRMVLA